jgi:hypothetical protein
MWCNEFLPGVHTWRSWLVAWRTTLFGGGALAILGEGVDSCNYKIVLEM